MPYTYKALAAVWVFTLILFALSATGTVTGPWIVMLAAAALGAPLTLPLWPKPRDGGLPDAVPITRG